jgi:guanylate kinase
MSKPRGLILYGPPAAGKDSVTQALTDIDAGYQLLRKLKAGRGNQRGYRFRSAADLDRMESAGDLLYRSTRYGNEYAIDIRALDHVVGRGAVPIVHMGQLVGVTAVQSYAAIRWHAVLLWCARGVALERVSQRGDRDATERGMAWDETRADLLSQPRFSFDLAIRTDRASVAKSAAVIHQAVNGGLSQRDPVAVRSFLGVRV